MDSWLFLLLGLLLGIPFSIFSNFATPWVKSYWEKSSLSILERRIYSLKSDYRHVANLTHNIGYLGRFAFFTLGAGVYIVLVMVSIFGISSLLFLIRPDYVEMKAIFLTLALGSYALLFVTSIAFSNFFLSLYKAVAFYTYKEKTIKKLVKLGGNPEELDKIDEEIEENK